MNEDDYIFITFDGTSHHKYIGRTISNFMRDTMNIYTSITGLRTLVETEADRKLIANERTPAQPESASQPAVSTV